MQRSQKTWGLLLLFALMLGTGWFLLRDFRVRDLVDILQRLAPQWLLLGLLLMLLFVGSEALCSHLILRRLGHKPRYHQCLGYSFIGFYVSSITPSSTGGQPAQVYQMAKDGIPAAHGALNMLLISVCYQVISLAYAIAAFFCLGRERTALGSGLGILLLYGSIVLGVLTVGMLALMFLPRVARRLSNSLLRLLLRLKLVRYEEKARATLAQQLDEYRAGASCFRQNPTLIPLLLGINFVQLTALFSVPYVVYRAFGLHDASMLQVVGMQALLCVAVGSLPLPGSVGVAESGFLAAFALFFGTTLVTPAVLISRGISFYSFLFISGVVTLVIQLQGRYAAKRTLKPTMMSGNTYCREQL